METKPKDGGPAFPQYGPDRQVHDRTTATGGMSLRDYFAGLAMQPLIAAALTEVGAQVFQIAAKKVNEPNSEKLIATAAVQQADALIAALNK